MRTVHEAFREAKILHAGEAAAAVLLECARLGRALRERSAHTIGLAPVDDDVAVPAVAIELGRALADGGARRVGVLDANGTWPCAGDLLELARGGGEGTLATSWLEGELAVLTPRTFEGRAAAALLRRSLAEGSLFDHVVVDLTGFAQLGEQQAAIELLDAVVAVARAGRTQTRRIRRVLRDLANPRGLGVLLTGA